MPLDPELLAELEEEAASCYTEEENQFTEVVCTSVVTHVWCFVSAFLFLLRHQLNVCACSSVDALFHLPLLLRYQPRVMKITSHHWDGYSVTREYSC